MPKIAFFGTPNIAVWVLLELEAQGIVPSLIITNPDTPQGRKMVLTPSRVSVWADEHSIKTLKPSTLKDEAVYAELSTSGCELFIVAAYGKIIPQAILDIPKYKTLNVHPSLLPLLRGASPIRSAILSDMNPTGVSIMELTAGVDEGPLLAQKEIAIPPSEWPMRGSELDQLLAREGGRLLGTVLSEWIEGKITPVEQNAAGATYSQKITKEMGLIDLNDDPYKNLLKIRAFDGWPGTYFFHEQGTIRVRVKILDATIENGKLTLLRVIPEGKKEMTYEIFLKNH